MLKISYQLSVLLERWIYPVGTPAS